jgi:hypothetical protein
MKKIQVSLLAAAVVALLFSCSKESTPSAAETNSVLLAGAKGGTKSWKIDSLLFSKNGAAKQLAGLYGCQLDDVYKFSNNDHQDFEHNEGLSKCASTDSTLVENVSWALTSNGKNIEFGLEIFSQNYILTNLGPGTINSLTDKHMELMFTQYLGANTYVLYFEFSKL